MFRNENFLMKSIGENWDSILDTLTKADGISFFALAHVLFCIVCIYYHIKWFSTHSDACSIRFCAGQQSECKSSTPALQLSRPIVCTVCWSKLIAGSILRRTQCTWHQHSHTHTHIHPLSLICSKSCGIERFRFPLWRKKHFSIQKDRTWLSRPSKRNEQQFSLKFHTKIVYVFRFDANGVVEHGQRGPRIFQTAKCNSASRSPNTSVTNVPIWAGIAECGETERRNESGQGEGIKKKKRIANSEKNAKCNRIWIEWIFGLSKVKLRRAKKSKLHLNKTKK